MEAMMTKIGRLREEEADKAKSKSRVKGHRRLKGLQGGDPAPGWDD